MLLLACGLGSLAGAVALVPLCKLLGVRLGLVAQPRQDRWHGRPIPVLGGIAVALPPLTGALLFSPISENYLPVACCAAIFAVGLVDDVRPLKPQAKLIPQIALASLLTFFGYRLGWSDSLTVDALLTMVWLVGITNAMNLLDNMDGLCAGIAAIAALALLIGMYPSSGPSANALLLTLLLGSCVGFLLFNFYPATIFMGDSGALFLGLALATIGLQLPSAAQPMHNVLSVVAAPVLVLLIPIFDTTFVTFSRILSGRLPSQGGRDHSSHRLVAIGLPERTAVLVLWTLAALAGAAGLAMRLPRDDAPFSATALFALGMIVFAAYLARVKVYDAQDTRLRTGGITLLMVDAVHKRRVLEVLLDAALVSIAYYSAYRLRFGPPEYSPFFPSFLSSLPLVIGIQTTTFFAVGVYRGVWGSFNLMDGVVLAKGVVLGTLVVVVAILFLYRFEQYSRGVFVIYATLLLLFVGGSKASFRLISEFVRRRRRGQRLLVYGAGAGGSLVARELTNLGRTNHRMLGFVHDDPAKLRLRVQGYPVLGGFDGLVALVSGGAVDTVVISTQRLDPERLKEIERLCGAHHVRLERLHFRLEEIQAAS
jgi:UDP-GlcNAc:undecaprenyl-phosphate GlcNAc-1-phosphate transferase